MVAPKSFIQTLTALNEIADLLNQTPDTEQALTGALSLLIELMGLETGWIFVQDAEETSLWFGREYRLAAHHRLPPALALDSAEAWKSGCDCQALCSATQLQGPYNEVRCSRLASVGLRERHGLAVHASTPLRSGGRVFGIMNVAAGDWSAFEPAALALLANVGSQMGIALERQRLFDLVQDRRIHEQAALLDLSNLLLRGDDPEELMRLLVDQVRRLLDLDAAALLLPAAEPGYLAYTAASGWRQDPVTAGRRWLLDDRSDAAAVMANQQPVVVHDRGSGRSRPSPAGVAG